MQKHFLNSIILMKLKKGKYGVRYVLFQRITLVI